MKSIKRSILLFFLALLPFAQITLCLFNPGVLVTVPFPQQPPYVQLGLPLQIDPILVNTLELSNINLKTLSYNWNFTESQAIVKISNAAVLFDWKFNADAGQGTFQQTQYIINLDYKFITNSKNRIQINIISTKSKLGHSSVHLGGTTKQIVIVQVTNLILNHAAITFRKTIEKAISGAIQSFSSIFENDPKLICPVQQSKCVYLNTTLVSPPIISNKALLIQINGASYVTGQKNTQLNPDSVLFKTNSTKIQAHIHLRAIQQIFDKVVGLLPQSYNLDINSKFDVIDLRTIRISPLFPKMQEFESFRQFQIQMSNFKGNSSLRVDSQSLQASINFELNLLTKNPSTQRYEVYLPNSCKVSFSAGLKIIYGWKGISVRVQSLVIQSLDCNQEDIKQGLVNPEAFYEAQSSLLTLVKTGINGQINRKVYDYKFKNIQTAINGNIQTNEALFDITLNSVEYINESQPKSGFKVQIQQ